MIIKIDKNMPWYHGSNKSFDTLLEGSTITQWKELAEAFSHKPTSLRYEDDGSIIHNGEKDGTLYIVDEPVVIGIDIFQHPNSSMDKNAEWFTKRQLRVKRIK